MKLDLKFFYYPVKQILDAKDEEYIALWPIMDDFEKYINTAPILEICRLIVISYKEQYAQQKYWYRKLLDGNAFGIDYEYPKELDEESDRYAPKKVLKRNDFEYVLMRQFDDAAKNCYYLKEFEIKFSTSQNLVEFQTAIESGLEGKAFTKSSTTDQISYIVSNSPISKVVISNTKFLMYIDSEKWVWYPGS
ncbi:hypothetical protein [Kordia sp.]|uniref:hypothetical protein n=1 Tax=Kordia sp. TaxID=1965332 RepID=UPI003B5AC23C